MTPHRWAHDLGGGTLGTALAEVVAARDTGEWSRADRALSVACAHRVDPQAGSLFRGAPALAYVLHTAGDHPPYQAAREGVDVVVDELIRARLRAARARMQAGSAPRHREFDLIGGLTGLGALLLYTGRRPELLSEILTYLVALLDVPVLVGGAERPGWWSTDTPAGHPDPGGGHANLGLAHGVAGPVALLALAARTGHEVPDHRECLRRACGLLVQWATADTRDGETGGMYWPETVDALAWTDPPQQTAPGRPSWCYGAPGVARALQLAAITSDHHGARIVAELTLASCATARQLTRLRSDGGVCHGKPGLRLTVARARADAAPASILARMPLPPLTTRTDGTCTDPAGLLTGPDGIRLAVRTLDRNQPPPPCWDTCLLLTAP